MAKARYTAYQGRKKWEQERRKRAENPNWRPVLNHLARWLLHKFDSHFDQQGVNTKGATHVWAPRKHNYYWQGERLPKRPVLIRTGKMRRSMRADIIGNELKFSFDVEYWQYHEGGKGRMKRRVFVVTDEYAQVITDTLAYYRVTGEVKILTNL